MWNMCLLVRIVIPDALSTFFFFSLSFVCILFKQCKEQTQINAIHRKRGGVQKNDRE